LGLGIALIAAAGLARGESIVVIGEVRPPWLPELLHELGTAGFASGEADARWALRVTASPDRIDVVSRAANDGTWTVDEVVAVPRAAAARRRAIVRAVEILRARVTAPLPPVDDPAPTPAPSEPPPREQPRPPATTEPAPVAPLAIARASAPARPPENRAGRFSLGATAGLSASGGGVGAVPVAGLVARWTGRRLALWSRAAGAVVANTASGAEGTAAIRALTLSLGAAFLPMDAGPRRWSPLLGDGTVRVRRRRRRGRLSGARRAGFGDVGRRGGRLLVSRRRSRGRRSGGNGRLGAVGTGGPVRRTAGGRLSRFQRRAERGSLLAVLKIVSATVRRKSLREAKGVLQ
jgi:hypothetical protein